MKRKESRIGVIVNYIALPTIILLLWFAATQFELCPPTVLPSIEAVAGSFVTQAASGQLFADLGVSLLRVLKGFLIAAVLAVPLGVFMAVSLRGNRFFIGVFEALRQIPTIALIPLLIIWFGIGEATKVIMIAKSAFFPILLNTISGITETPKGYLELARLYQISPLRVFTRIYFPSAVPYIFTGLRLALGVSWTTVVAAEIVASSSGIGYRINDARMMMEPEVVIVGVLAIGVVGVIMDKGLLVLSKKLTPWLGKR